jgi:hypothetical protein
MHWSMIWINVPMFLLAALLGALVGLLLPRRWLRYSLVCGLAFLATPQALAWALGVHYYQLYGSLYISPYDIAPLPILLLVAGLGSRLRPAPVLPGHCRTCGYDLTGNVSGLCPECGTRSASVPTDVTNLPNDKR